MQFLKKAPILRLVIPYFLGIIPSLFLGINTNPVSSFGLVLFLGLCVVFLGIFQLKTNQRLYHSLFGGLLLLFFFFLGVYRWNSTRLENQANFFIPNNAEQIAIKITDKPLFTNEKGIKLQGEIIAQLKDSGIVEYQKGNCILYFKDYSEDIKFAVGDVFILPNRVQKIPPKVNPWGFDYPMFLSRQNIHFQGFYSFRDLIEIKPSGFHFLDGLKNLRTTILESYHPYFEDFNSFSVFAALVLGNKENLDDDISSQYANAGTMHVLAVSGLHVGILYFLLGLLLKGLKKRRWLSWCSAIIQISIIWIYAFITGLSPSIFRAATMFSCLIIGDQLERNSNIFNTLGISALILTLSQPELLASIGFQLSYLAVIGILIIFPSLYNLFNFKSKISNYLWGLVCVSIAAQLAVLPLSIFYFNQMPSYFLLANLFVIPMATMNLTIGLLASLFYWSSSLAFIFGWVLNYLLLVQNFMVEFISNLPYSFVSGLIIGNFEVLAFYCVLVGIVFLLINEDKKWLKLIFGGFLLFVFFNIYQTWQKINTNQVTIFNHPKSVYVDYNQAGNHTTFCFGPRDEYFEKFELAAFTHNSAESLHPIITKDSVCANFIKSNNSLLFPNFKIGVGDTAEKNEYDYFILKPSYKKSHQILGNYMANNQQAESPPQILNTQKGGPYFISFD